MAQLNEVIEGAWEKRTELAPGRVSREIEEAVEECVVGLDSGALRVAQMQGGQWVVNQWLKKAVLLSFRINDNQVVDAGFTKFYDKVPAKYAHYDAQQFRASGSSSRTTRISTSARTN